jgi:hypothetical protein
LLYAAASKKDGFVKSLLSRKKAQKAQEQSLVYSDDSFALFALYCG